MVATFPTEFIVAEKTLEEIHRVLANEGRLIIVLSGSFIGKGIVRSFLEWLYRITGQRPTGKRTSPMAEIPTLLASHGFDYRQFQEPCQRSMALVLVAQKRTGIH